MITTIGQDIDHAAKLLKKDQIVAIPTETVYGLAGNGYNLAVLAQIFAIKARPLFDPFIFHVHSIEAVMPLIAVWSAQAKQLAARFWPGPLTLILPKSNLVPDLATAGQDTVAVRIPDQSHTLQLLEMLPFPLVAPSANPFQAISPTTPYHVLNGLGGRIPYVLDGGATERGLESTIVGFIDDKPHIYRLGSLPVAEIEACIGSRCVLVSHGKTADRHLPGMSARHYAPNKPFFVGNIDQLLSKYKNKRIGLLTFEPHPIQGSQIVVRKVLSVSGEEEEAAQNLFAYMHALNQNKDVEVILTNYLPDKGLGKAINDRLRRAATQT